MLKFCESTEVKLRRTYLLGFYKNTGRFTSANMHERERKRMMNVCKTTLILHHITTKQNHVSSHHQYYSTNGLWRDSSSAAIPLQSFRGICRKDMFLLKQIKTQWLSVMII